MKMRESSHDSKTEKISRRFAADKGINEVRILGFEDFLLLIQPKSRANSNTTAIDNDADLIDEATSNHARGVITIEAGRAKPPPDSFSPVFK